MAAALAALMLAGPAQAQPPAGGEPGPAPQAPGAETLTHLESLVDTGRFQAVLEQGAALHLAALDPEARRLAHRLLGYAHLRQGNFSAAREHYLEVLAVQLPMPDEVKAGTHYTVAQLQFALGDFQAAASHMRIWQQTGAAHEASHGPFILMAQALFKVRDYAEAIASLESGLARAEVQGAPVQEHWLRLLHHLYVEEHRWQEAVAVLERLQSRYPNPEYDSLLRQARSRLG